jgi:hypothetical protein
MLSVNVMIAKFERITKSDLVEMCKQIYFYHLISVLKEKEEQA